MHTSTQSGFIIPSFISISFVSNYFSPLLLLLSNPLLYSPLLTFRFLPHVGARCVEDKNLESTVQNIDIALCEGLDRKGKLLDSYCALAYKFVCIIESDEGRFSKDWKG